MKLLFRFCFLFALLAVPAWAGAQTDTTRRAAPAKPAAALVHFLREKDASSGNEVVITFRNQAPFALNPGATVAYSVNTEGPITITVETRPPVTGTSQGQFVTREVALTVRHGETYDFLLKGTTLKAIARAEALKIGKDFTPFTGAESPTTTINAAPVIFPDDDGPAFSTITFLRSGNFVGSACRTDLTLPNQRDVPLSLGSVVHYKVYSEGDIPVTLDLRCPGAGYMPPTSRAVQLTISTKQGETHYVLYNASSFAEISLADARKYLDKSRNVMKQEESLDLPINRGSVRAAAKRSGKGQSTCFLISPDGYLVTNFHCVENSTELKVKGINGDFNTAHPATVVAKDPSNDLALLKLTDAALKFPALPYQLRTTGILQAERIYALGFPVAEALGNEIKITEGIISARSGMQGDVSKFQISAAVNPGNSGGPLIDEDGNLIGVVFAKMGAIDATGYAVKSVYLDTFLKTVDSFPYPTFSDQLKPLKLPQKVAALEKCIFLLETN